MSKKDKILYAAQEMFGRHGYANTTMKMIADRAGVASGLVSHYYGTKDNLFLEAGDDLIDKMLVFVTEKAQKAPSGLEAIGIFVKSYLDFTLKNKETFPTLLRCSPFSDDYPDLDRHQVASKFKKLIDQISNYLEKGMADGSIEELPLTQTSFLLYGHIVGAVRTVFLAPYDSKGVFEEACHFIIRSIAKQ
ncbi:TetR/AcrR family transcriptional regulator [Maridesulfovibrio bastinii]|uniref:TetR/AcrR family transcriptional regulator n=1 Tax=Maridesulfovibrio bastinii TaxID=47157 RepID=UPI0004089BAE|nr:TetR/AcrR family transcriptional regulator [Maridesulfovibrio bastinii]